MTSRQLAFIAGLGSAALLTGAFLFQFFGYAPCQMCLWQRWPHAAAVGAGVLGLTGMGTALWALVGGLSALTTAGIGAFHTGVERGWWDGPQACSGGGSLSGLSGEALLSTEGLSDIVRCDEVAWAFAGLSMASWNMVVSLGLAVVWSLAFLKNRTA